MTGPSEIRRVLITGASSGIGMASAIAFARRGAGVALLARGEQGLARCAEAVREAGGEAVVAPADVTDHAALEAAVGRAIDELGGLDCAVVNAGAAAYGPFAETGRDDFDRTLAVTLRGAVDTIRLVLPALERSGGALVVVGSVAGSIPLPMLAAYTAAKHGLRGFVDALQIEHRAAGSAVSISLVSPGPVDTPFWDDVATQEGRLPPSIPGAYDPEDVAKAVVLCAERRSAGLTVGWAMLGAGLLHSLLNPLSERVLAAIARWARAHGEEGPGRQAIRKPAGRGELRAGLRSRPSLMLRGLAAVQDVSRAIAR